MNQISRWPVPEITNLPEDLRARILDVQAKAGFVPNVFLAFAHRPDEARAFFAWHDALLVKDTGTLTKAEREMVIGATYYLKADINDRQRAMLAFALKVCNHSGNIVEADFEALRLHGFTDEDIWDIGAITALFGLSNRMANLLSLRPNDEFYLMGRVPKKA